MKHQDNLESFTISPSKSQSLTSKKPFSKHAYTKSHYLQSKQTLACILLLSTMFLHFWSFIAEAYAN